MRLRLGVVLALTMIAPAAAQTTGYVGDENRAVKALSDQEVADLLAGRGIGMARAGELNHYPGPAHVLELKDQLRLTPDQLRTVEATFAAMSRSARPLGAALVERERALDQAFATRRITPERIAAETRAIGALQGELRAIHLAAHLETRAALTPEQIARYDRLRGYAGGTPGADHLHHMPPPPAQ